SLGNYASITLALNQVGQMQQLNETQEQVPYSLTLVPSLACKSIDSLVSSYVLHFNFFNI
ncbi:hypothetical protein PSY31_23965, partial [Shigella flexneri]|nr:hypothetical protein [Shigella flexneri]